MTELMVLIWEDHPGLSQGSLQEGGRMVNVSSSRLCDVKAEQRERRCCVVAVKEEATNQGMQVASRSWKGQRKFLL